MAGTEVMQGLALLDPTLHEFLPHDKPSQRPMAQDMHVPIGKIKIRVEELHEFNPMMGRCGYRLGISYPQIAAMQARAIFESALNVQTAGIAVKVEIMVPLVGTVREFNARAQVTRRVVAAIFAERGESLNYTRRPGQADGPDLK